MKEIQKIVEIKNGGKWEVSHICKDEKEIYKDLSNALISKKLHQCSYIRSIKDKCNYDGTRNITILYSNNVKATYTVKDH